MGARSTARECVAEVATQGRLAACRAPAVLKNFSRHGKQQPAQQACFAYYQAHSAEAARLAHAAGKLMGAFNDAVLTVQRRRSGGRQVVQVIHQQVAVGPGGKAIVAGSSKAGARPG